MGGKLKKWYNRSMRRKVRGFTLVELSLSMVFIGVLLIAIALIISNTVSAYRRGLTLNLVNTVGMDIVDDMRTAVQNASSGSVLNDCRRYYAVSGGADERNVQYQNCYRDKAFHFVSIWKNEDVELDGVTYNMPVYGAFCTGKYSYIWNSGYFEQGKVVGASPNDYNKRAKFRYVVNNETVTIEKIRLLKVEDDERGVCKSVVRPYEDGAFGSTYPAEGSANPYKDGDGVVDNTFVMNGYGSMSEDPVDLLINDGDKYNDLAIYNLTVGDPPAYSSTQKNTFYAVSFILGTLTGGPNVMSVGQSCKSPAEYADVEYGGFEYCAINKFN
ncbi:prepilin-type N-terminal cleavage/methylation domain-containing protein, partial [Candidatus Saccharibacteria bacterium]|nr:prepilin-type N-terminal cleavage/methylation domain-containing protein [Candidatus Saccharibacteria bacterium]